MKFFILLVILAIPGLSAAKRIISLSPVITETLFALDVGYQVVGVTRYCDRPAKAKLLPKVGGIDIQLEALLALKPDLVIAPKVRTVHPAFAQLNARRIPILHVRTDAIKDITDMIHSIGLATGSQANAKVLLRQFYEQMRQLKATQTSNRSVILVAGVNPLVLAGPGSFAHEALLLLGFRSPLKATSNQWPIWSFESLIRAKPNTVVLMGGPSEQALFLKEWRSLSHLKATNSMQIVFDRAALLQRPGINLPQDIMRLKRLLNPSPAGGRRIKDEGGEVAEHSI